MLHSNASFSHELLMTKGNMTQKNVVGLDVKIQNLPALKDVAWSQKVSPRLKYHQQLNPKVVTLPK